MSVRLVVSHEWEQHTSVVPDYWALATGGFAVAQHAKVDVAVGSEGDALDDGCRQCREQQQTKGDEE